MRSLTEEINDQLKTGRRTVDRSMGEIQKQFRGADLRRVRVLAAGALIAALASGCWPRGVPAAPPAHAGTAAAGRFAGIDPPPGGSAQAVEASARAGGAGPLVCGL